MENQVKEWMVAYITSVMSSAKAEEIDVETTLDNLGLDSVEAVIMAGLMEEEFQTPIDPIELYENPSIAAFAKHFATKNSKDPVPAPGA